MMRIFLAPRFLTLLGLSAITLLGGCFEKKGRCAPEGGTCDTAAVVVNLGAATGLGLLLPDSTCLAPTGRVWADFNAKAGDRVTIGYTVKAKSASPACPTGKSVELGCITLISPATAPATGTK